jgi:two-component system, NtrC family, sensor histidine kinase HydH
MGVEIPMQEHERQRLLEQYAEIATLAGGLAHEIKNPLSTIGMNLELLSEDLAGSDVPRDRRMLMKIQTVQRECRHLEEILNAFLQFARVGELDLAECDLNALVREFIDFYQPQAHEQGIEISPHLASDLPPVRLDRSLIRQVLMNLALNAQQAMPSGGLLELQTYQRDGCVHLRMIDNGVGMDERAQAKMFQVFFSTKPGGSGLGLPTVRKIVAAHHGAISCESELGRGTRFTISLPLDE